MYSYQMEHYTCSICPFSTSDERIMKKHDDSHLSKHQYPCDTCHKIFSTATLLKRHLRIHTGELPFQCSVCAKTFNRKDNLNAHFVVHLKKWIFRKLLRGKYLNIEGYMIFKINFYWCFTEQYYSNNLYVIICV